MKSVLDFHNTPPNLETPSNSVRIVDSNRGLTGKHSRAEDFSVLEEIND